MIKLTSLITICFSFYKSLVNAARPTLLRNINIFLNISNTEQKSVSEVDVYKFGNAEQNYPDLSNHHCYMAKVMTLELYERMYQLETSSGFTFDKVIQTGVDNPGHPFIVNVGAVAGDQESYQVFSEFFDKIVEIRHNYPSHAKQVTNINVDQVLDLTLDKKYVISTRIRTGRSIAGIPFSPNMNRYQRREVERVVSKAVENLTGDLFGKYYSLSSLTEEETNNLVNDHFLFQKPDSPLLTTAGMARDWPDARGIFHNDDKNFLVWVNEEDHIRIISMQQGGDVKAVFSRFSRAVTDMEASIKKTGYEFAFDDHFGFLTTCPSNLGTGLRASALVKIPLLEKHPRFKEIFKPLRMQRRGTYGVDSDSIGGVHDVSNSDRLGQSEVDLVNIFIFGTTQIIELEKSLEQGNDIENMIDDIINNPVPTPEF